LKCKVQFSQKRVFEFDHNVTLCCSMCHLILSNNKSLFENLHGIYLLRVFLFYQQHPSESTTTNQFQLCKIVHRKFFDGPFFSLYFIHRIHKSFINESLYSFYPTSTATLICGLNQVRSIQFFRTSLDRENIRFFFIFAVFFERLYVFDVFVHDITPLSLFRLVFII